jgi:FAD/FMN-containing dehydrogenase
VGAALVIDFSKYLNRVLNLDVEEQIVSVEPGINLESLNRLLKPNGLMFGPDPSSGNRATAGGVVGNNSTGAHSILYGMTGDNLVSIRCALAEGGTVDFGAVSAEDLEVQSAASDTRGRLLSQLRAFGDAHANLIRRDFPPHWTFSPSAWRRSGATGTELARRCPFPGAAPAFGRFPARTTGCSAPPCSTRSSRLPIR